MIKVVLFDLDGTLIDSSEGIFKSVLYALEHYGIHETDMGSLRRFIGPPLYESFMRFYDFPEEQAREAVDVFRERYNVKGFLECKLYDGVKEALVSLKEAGYALGVATSKPEETARKILSNKGVYDLFDEIAGATMDGRIETKQEVLTEWFRRKSEYTPDASLLVGDTAFDVTGANAFGMKSIGVSFGFGSLDEMQKAGAVAICDSMAEVVDVVKGC